ncbi:MAG: hypothetical protein ABEJ81_00730 [Haloferacaceae archaeon]
MSRRTARPSVGVSLPAYGLLLVGLVSVTAGSLPAVAALTTRAPALATGRATLSATPLVATAALWCGGLVAALFGLLLVAAGRR